MSKTLVFSVLAAFIVLAGGVFYLNSKPAMSTDTAPAAETTEAAADESLPAIDVEAALSDRILGDPNAPIRISEHSSFTCSHCGNFHKNSFKTVKAELIDTGKAYLVFSDFPLNGPALHASVIARCLPHDKYFDFVQMLFEQQDAWAFDPNYIQFLQAKANEAGLDTPMIKACLSSEPLQNGVLERMAASRTQWNVESTPSFVVNNKTVISGAIPVEDFIKQVNEAAAGTP